MHPRTIKVVDSEHLQPGGGGQMRLMWLLVTAAMMDSRRSDSVAHAQICHLLTSFFQKRHPDVSVWKGVSRAVIVETDEADGNMREIVTYIVETCIYFLMPMVREEKETVQTEENIQLPLIALHGHTWGANHGQAWKCSFHYEIWDCELQHRDQIYIILYVFHRYT